MRLAAGALEKALAAALPLVPLANVEETGAFPEAHWYLMLTIDEGGHTYPYKILLRRRGSPEPLVAAMHALRSLAPLPKP